MSGTRNAITSARMAVILLLWTIAGTGCETTRHTIDYEKQYPSAQQRIADRPAVLLQVEDAIPEEEFRKAQNFLGEDMTMFATNVFIIPMNKYSIYSADQPRSQLVGSVLQEHFSTAGLPTLALSGQKPGPFDEGAREALSVSVRVKKLAVTTSFSGTILPLLFTTIITFHDKQVDTVLDCQITQPGSQAVLWKGTLSGKAESKELEKMDETARAKVKNLDAWMVHEAIDRAVSAFLTQSQAIQIAVRLRNETFAKAMKTAQDTEAGGNLRAALNQYGRAYRAAGDSEQSLAVIKTVAEVVRKLPNRPELPEDARRYGVQANTATERKGYDEAITLLSQGLEAAPWWAEGHFNRALLLANQNRYQEAVTSMKQFLILTPNAPDARASQDKIYEWELKAGPVTASGLSANPGASSSPSSTSGPRGLSLDDTIRGVVEKR
ncbi:MAG: tetratricopeptide repeat protein [Nitrospirae bacterium]|nr:tetratricopeptide repeat protein [Nitrospirota bacterium]